MTKDTKNMVSDESSLHPNSGIHPLHSGEKNSRLSFIPASGKTPVKAGDYANQEIVDLFKQTLEAIELNFEAHRHNIRNPLTVTATNIDLIKEKLHELEIVDPEIKEILQDIGISVKRIIDAVNQTLPNLEKALGRDPLHCERIDIQELLENVTKEFEEKATFEVFPLSIMAVAFVDPAHLRQVLYNIIENAIKFNESPQKKIRIITVGKPGKLRIDIEDNGPGIEEENEAMLFTPGYRETKVLHIPGTGLGLSYCRRIIEQMGGKIYAANNPATGGAVFSLELPVKD